MNVRIEFIINFLFDNLNSSIKVKSGKTKGRQRYKCKECGCNYSV